MDFKTILLALLLLSLSCNTAERGEREYERCILPNQKGKVLDKFLNRGNIATITLNTDDNSQNEYLWIYGNNNAYNLINIGDSLIKYPNSNKLLLIKKDSIIKMSNYTHKDLQVLYDFDSWDSEELNKWELK